MDLNLISSLLKQSVPSLCDSIDFGLSNEKTNREKLQALLPQKKETLEDSPTHEFFMVGDWAKKGFLVLFNKKTQLISYYVRFEVIDLIPKLPVVTQVAVWRSQLDPAAVGKARQVFFDILLEHYRTIASDSIQSQRGMEFWQQSMAVALSRGFRIGIANTSSKELFWKDPERDLREWLEEQHAWGFGEEFESLRFIISHL